MNSGKQKALYLHTDNCTSQNKNNATKQYLLWRVMTGKNDSIELSFMFIGHTKFSPDRFLGSSRRCVGIHLSQLSVSLWEFEWLQVLSNNNCAGLGASCQKQGNSKAASRVQYGKRQSKRRTTFNVCTRQQNLIPSMTCFVGNYYMSHDHEIQIYSCTTLENNSEVTVSMAKRYTEESDFVFTKFPSRYSNHH